MGPRLSAHLQASQYACWLKHSSRPLLQATGRMMRFTIMQIALVVLGFLLPHKVVWCMLAKNKRPYNPEVLSNRERVRADLRDIVGGNLLSSSRTQEIVDDTHACGIRGFRDLSSRGKTNRPRSKNNSARRLRTKFLKGCLWPPVYWARVRVISIRTKREVYEWCAIMLPHEYVDVLRKYGDSSVLHKRRGMDVLSFQHLQYCEAQTGCQMLGVGLWGTGPPAIGIGQTQSKLFR